MSGSEAVVHRTRTLRLLLVEDEPDVLTFYKQLFEHEGFDVSARATAREGAIEAARREFDVALVDERLPDVHGKALLRWLRRRFPRMKLVLFSAYANWGMYFRGCACGAVDVLSKNTPSREVLRVVRSALPVSEEA